MLRLSPAVFPICIPYEQRKEKKMLSQMTEASSGGSAPVAHRARQLPPAFASPSASSCLPRRPRLLLALSAGRPRPCREARRAGEEEGGCRRRGQVEVPDGGESKAEAGSTAARLLPGLSPSSAGGHRRGPAPPRAPWIRPRFGNSGVGARGQDVAAEPRAAGELKIQAATDGREMQEGELRGGDRPGAEAARGLHGCANQPRRPWSCL
jgi:hypothetical protein